MQDEEVFDPAARDGRSHASCGASRPFV